MLNVVSTVQKSAEVENVKVIAEEGDSDTESANTSSGSS